MLCIEITRSKIGRCEWRDSAKKRSIEWDLGREEGEEKQTQLSVQADGGSRDAWVRQVHMLGRLVDAGRGPSERQGVGFVSVLFVLVDWWMTSSVEFLFWLGPN